MCVGRPVHGSQYRAEIRISEVCQLTGCVKSDEGLYIDIRYTGDENSSNFKCITEFRISSYTPRALRLSMFQISNLKMSIWTIVVSACYMYIDLYCGIMRLLQLISRWMIVI